MTTKTVEENMKEDARQEKEEATEGEDMATEITITA